MPACARESVSVIVPFAGSERELDRVLCVLGRLARREGDEVIVADNRNRAARYAGRATQREGRTAGPAGSLRILPATGVLSPAFARNTGARIATGEWLLFIDADTEPSPSLLDDYFDPLPGERTAVLAGYIVDVPSRASHGARRGRASLAARHTLARGQMSQRTTLERRGTPYAQTANCVVRRSAFAGIGGFEPEIRAGEDADLCFRLASAGWQLEERPEARVAHVTRPTLSALLGQLARHGSGAAWLERRYPGEFPAPRARELAARARNGAAGFLAALRHGEGEAAAFAVLDIVTASAFDAGRLLSNQARRPCSSTS